MPRPPEEAPPSDCVPVLPVGGVAPLGCALGVTVGSTGAPDTVGELAGFADGTAAEGFAVDTAGEGVADVLVVAEPHALKTEMTNTTVQAKHSIL